MTTTIKAKRNQLVTASDSKLGFYEDNGALMKKIQSNLYAIHKRLDSLETVNIKLEDMLINNYNALDKIEERLKQIENRLEEQISHPHIDKKQESVSGLSTAQFIGTNPH